jgi:hypothetical protein
MFSLGAQGRLVPTKIENPDNQNVVAYAAAPNSTAICFTLINREHGGKTAEFALATGFSKSNAQVMLLTAPGNDVAIKTGITLGGAGIADDGAWEGKWTPLPGPAPDGDYLLKLPPASAALVNLTTR